MRRTEAIIAAATLAGSAALTFTRLGHSALWNDEAYTALLARSVWRTGDTHAVLGHNIIAFQGGAALENLRHRFDPPLAYYLAAPFLGLLGSHALAARLPFALCGLATIALMVRWAWRERAATLTWLILAIAILGNVSLVLYSRQCRYYALAMLLSTALAYLYLHWDGSRRGLAVMAAVSLCLLATNYINYAAFYACAAVDYLVWKGRHRLTRRDALLLFAPQLILGALIISVWNPLGKAIVPYESTHWLKERGVLLWWNIRDLSRCEFGVGMLLPWAPLLYWAGKSSLFARGCVALVTYILAVTMLSPQPVMVTDAADVRYLVPLIPLYIGLGVAGVRSYTKRAWLAIPIAIVAFGTNLFQFSPYMGEPVRSAVVEYVGELAQPRETAYGVAAAWVNANLAEGESIWVVPESAVSPLMFHAPKAVYAWQLRWPPAEQFRGLPDIHFMEREPPDYVLAFGSVSGPLAAMLGAGGHYARVAALDAYWRDGPAGDGTRPELFWHAFRPARRLCPETDCIHIFRRISRGLGGLDLRRPN